MKFFYQRPLLSVLHKTLQTYHRHLLIKFEVTRVKSSDKDDVCKFLTLANFSPFSCVMTVLPSSIYDWRKSVLLPQSMMGIGFDVLSCNKKQQQLKQQLTYTNNHYFQKVETQRLIPTFKQEAYLRPCTLGLPKEALNLSHLTGSNSHKLRR